MNRKWWQESVVYQIYPRSFKDSDGDGIGDLRGIIDKLDYLKLLGIDVVWLSPVYQSPNDDNGYDISDYYAIMDEFGTMADWEEMLAGMHERGIKLVMDLVVNHTSDEHAWFEASRRSRDNAYRDYYIWRPAKDGRVPNNWAAFFGGSAWEYDEPTDEYYLHLFTKKQPDLNWENPAVRQSIYKMMDWWFRKGVDGFRMDVINLISKKPGLPDLPATGPGPYHMDARAYAQGPRLMEFLDEMKREVLSKYDIMTVGESVAVTPEDARALTAPETGPLNMVFHFEHMSLDRVVFDGAGPPRQLPWKLAELKAVLSRWQTELADKGWNSLYFNNHDQPRSVSRFGDDGRYRVQSAKMLATLLHMMHGTPYIYQGEEIGMTNVAFDTIADYRDIATRNMFAELVDEKGFDPADILPLVHYRSRDNARTPVQWEAGANAGFTAGEPWIKVNPNYPAINVAQALADPDSIFHYYRRLIQLRHEHAIVVHGLYDLILADHDQIYAYTRTLDDKQLLVITNFSDEPTDFRLPDDLTFTGKSLLIANYEVDSAAPIDHMTLRPYEARVYLLNTA